MKRLCSFSQHLICLNPIINVLDYSAMVFSSSHDELELITTVPSDLLSPFSWIVQAAPLARISSKAMIALANRVVKEAKSCRIILRCRTELKNFYGVVSVLAPVAAT